MFVKGGVGKCCVNAFCVTACLCAYALGPDVVFVWPAASGCCMWRSDVACQSEAVLHVSLYALHLGVGLHVACVPFLCPSASFWVMSRARCQNVFGHMLLGFLCVWLFIGSLCRRPFILFSDYTHAWHCVPGYIVCRGESVCHESFYEYICTSRHVHDVCPCASVCVLGDWGLPQVCP